MKIIIILLLVLSNCAVKEETEQKYKPPVLILKEAAAPVETSFGVRFTYYDKKAKVISIVGDFNNWNDNVNYLVKNEYNIWSITLPLDKGGYSYKFNVDGIWTVDPKNPKTVTDDMGDVRSYIEVEKGIENFMQDVYEGPTNGFLPQFTDSGIIFAYKDKKAKSVSVAGTFNNWQPNMLKLSKNKNGVWLTIIPLRKGEYLYKYFVDGLWIQDPNNYQTRDDGMGELCSVLNVPWTLKSITPSGPQIVSYKTVRFTYKNNALPSDIIIPIIGSFNNWDETKNFLTDKNEDKIWEGFVDLLPGNYYYRYKVEGKEILDISNPYKKLAPDGNLASYLEIVQIQNQRNVKFTYIDENAESVYIVGDFNCWNTEANPMIRDNEGRWYINLSLAPGGYAYQFIVDGKWKLDLGNKDAVIDENGDWHSFYIVR